LNIQPFTFPPAFEKSLLAQHVRAIEAANKKLTEEIERLRGKRQAKAS